MCIITNILYPFLKTTCTCRLASLGHFPPQKLGALLFGVSISLRHSCLQWLHFSHSPDSDRKGCSPDPEKSVMLTQPVTLHIKNLVEGLTLSPQKL